MTPLIDIVFLLLIFFLVATRFAEEDREMDVELPSATEARALIVQPREIFVNIDSKGDIYVGGQRYDVPQLEQHLIDAKLNNPLTQSVIIRADKRTQLDVVVHVINACSKAGVGHSLTTSAE